MYMGEGQRVLAYLSVDDKMAELHRKYHKRII
jgi:hypothetical protein